jgi:hypothetical protein
MKSQYLQYRAFELTIEDGKVISKRPLDRGAGDLIEIQVSRAEEALWGNREQNEKLVEDVETVR